MGGASMTSSGGRPHRKLVPPVTASKDGDMVGGIDNMLDSPFMTGAVTPACVAAFRQGPPCGHWAT
jgi:hypothetical protein